MNYLAHLLLGEHSAESLIGNLSGDFVKGAPDPQCPAGVKLGIMLHRKVDIFTDAHPRIVASRRLISSTRRRFAGIILDVSFDHFLSRHWGKYMSVGRTQFISDVYRILCQRSDLIPEALRPVVPRLVAEDWLSGYLHLECVAATLDRISRRSARAACLQGSVDELLLNYDALEDAFLEFFPDVLHFAKRCSRQLKLGSAQMPRHDGLHEDSQLANRPLQTPG